MNVENRKLFANRDARKRLAEMGGILASSPELMGEAMKFANGGQAQEQEFIINIPGLTIPGEMLRIKESTLMQLGNMFPDLMGQQNALVQPVELMGAEAMNARPGDAVIGTRISRMMQQSAPEEVVLESAPITSGEQPSLMDRIRTTVQSAQSVNPIEDAFKEIGPAITSAVPGLSQYEGQPNPYVEALKNAGLSEDPVAFDPQGLMSPPMYDVSSLEVPKMGDILASEQLISAAPPGVGTMPVTLTSEEIQNAIASGNAEILELAQQQGLLDREIEKAPAPKPEAKLPVPAPSDETTADSFSEALSKRPRLANQSTLGKNKEDLVVAAENTNPAAANDSLTEALRQKFMDRDSDIVPFTVDQLTKEPPKGDPDDDTPDAPKPDAPKTRKQRMLESVEMISELFGIREKDKAEDMYDLMATIGFAMASGESPNAMKNIADAFLIGAQMKRADKDKDEERKEKLDLLALQGELDLESQEAALKQTLAEETRAEQRNQRKMRFQFGLDAALERLKLSGATQKGLRNAILDMAKEVTGYTGKPPTPEELETIGTAVLTLPGFEGMSLNDINPAGIGVDKKSAVEQKYKIKNP